MVNYFKEVVNEESQIKAGIKLSVGLIAISLAVPLIEAVFEKFNIKITLFDGLVVFLWGGIFIFFIYRCMV